jgi:transposase-like protein
MPTGKVKEVAAMLKAIHAQEDAKAAKEKALQVVEKLRAMRLAKAAEIVDNGIDETLSYYNMPPEHRPLPEDQQPAGAANAKDPATNESGRRLPG